MLTLLEAGQLPTLRTVPSLPTLPREPHDSFPTFTLHPFSPTNVLTISLKEASRNPLSSWPLSSTT